ncbi:MAG TPA: cell division protein FtsA [Rhizomicrobium sp.]
MGEAIRLRVNNEIPAYRPGLVSALDIGSSKVACVIGRAEQGSLKILGSALRESAGIRSGTITSLELAEESIRDCVAAAENHADARIQNVLISVNCGQPASVNSRAVMALDGALVSDSHLRQLLNEGRTRCRLDGHEIIQSAPTAYVVDEARGVRNPSGMFCQRIGVAMHAVAVRPSPLQNLKLAVERCHLNVVGTLFSAYASGLATLSEDEKQIGATVIDMGGGCTSIAVFLEGHLVYADVVPKGGFSVTTDVAQLFTAPLSAAERVKTLYGAAMGDMESGSDVIAIPQTGEQGEEAVQRVPRSMLARVIQPRLQATFEEVQKRLQASGFDLAAGRRAVLTGGACQLAGTRELAASILNKQVRIGRPQSFPGLAAANAGPDYATAIGLLMAGATMPPEMINPDIPMTNPTEERKGWWGRLTGRWLE